MFHALLSEVPAHCLQSALADLDKAYGNFFAGHAGYPRPRKHFENDSFTFPDPGQIRLDRAGSQLVLPKFSKRRHDAGALRVIAQKAVLNRAILGKGWGELERQLAYKLTWAGGRLIKVDSRNTSRTCGCCGHIDAQSRIGRDRFLCRSCGHEEHADTNAAHENLRRGLAELGLSLPPRQELSWQPAEPSAPVWLNREEKNDGISRRMRLDLARPIPREVLELNA